jgi:hypothetical protein
MKNRQPFRARFPWCEFVYPDWAVHHTECLSEPQKESHEVKNGFVRGCREDEASNSIADHREPQDFVDIYPLEDYTHEERRDTEAEVDESPEQGHLLISEFEFLLHLQEAGRYDTIVIIQKEVSHYEKGKQSFPLTPID